jgi:NitT/TauT family transport system permease protein
MTSFITYLSVQQGIADSDADREAALRLMGGSSFDIWIYLKLFGMVPYLMASLRLNMTVGFVAALVSEMILSNQGLGYVLDRDSVLGDLNGMFSIVLVCVIYGVVVNLLVGLVERRVDNRWG